MAGLGLAMDVAVHAIRDAAAAHECIAKRQGWRLQVAINSDNDLAIVVVVPRKSESEWQDVPRPAGTPVYLEKCPAPVQRLGDALQTAVRNRGLHESWMRVFLRLWRGRDLWIYQVCVPAPDDHGARRLKNHR
ncbi:hypothetical protein LZC95_49950 [Pendulispora brunnea]|uniref:Uncharacterized protein n=1 Tax=Pendulispora brunnea TaxID=2905690 RepID=A0ABZ2K778_9BACT